MELFILGDAWGLLGSSIAILFDLREYYVIYCNPIFDQYHDIRYRRNADDSQPNQIMIMLMIMVLSIMMMGRNRYLNQTNYRYAAL